MFERPHHQRIAHVLLSLNGPLLLAHHCLFGGGTAMALRYGEYRESVDIDFLVSDITSYRALRQLLTSTQGVAAITRPGVEPLQPTREVRADQYGLRTALNVAGQPIKFEIVLEGRIALADPSADGTICGIATLTPLDMATSKLLANSDRCMDDGVFSRDLIDLAMMAPPLPLLHQAVVKAEQAYGASVCHDLDKAIARMRERQGRLERCMKALDMNMPRALLWQKIRALRRVLPS